MNIFSLNDRNAIYRQTHPGTTHAMNIQVPLSYIWYQQQDVKRTAQFKQEHLAQHSITDCSPTLLYRPSTPVTPPGRLSPPRMPSTLLVPLFDSCIMCVVKLASRRSKLLHNPPHCHGIIVHSRTCLLFPVHSQKLSKQRLGLKLSLRGK